MGDSIFDEDLLADSIYRHEMKHRRFEQEAAWAVRLSVLALILSILSALVALYA